MVQGPFKDRNALAFEDNEGTVDTKNAFYVGKRKRSSKGLEVVFDQEQHRDYVTGFHKRKVERRNKAQKEKAEKDKKQRLEERAEKRAKLREELDIERYETDPKSEREDKATKGKGVKVYKSGSALTTVTIAPLMLASDEEAGNDEEARSQGSDGSFDEGQRPAEKATSKQTVTHRDSRKGQKQGRQKQNKKGKMRKKGSG